jgi:hypothetical protein
MSHTPWHTDGGTTTDEGQTTDTTTTTTTSSSPAPAAPADPFKTDPVKARKLSEFQSVYTQLWGEPATEEYLKNAINQGANRWEFAEHERKKPAFRKTKTYRDDASARAELLHNLGAV